jgi:hypothetical protein
MKPIVARAGTRLRAAASFNKPDAASSAIASRLHARHHWRGIADPGRWPIDPMKPQSLLVAFLLLGGCSSPPKDVSEAWRQFRHVRQGMTRQEVHAVLKDVNPTLSESGSPDSRVEVWIAGQPFAHPGHSAGLSLTYGSDDRVVEVSRWRHRSPAPPDGLNYR